MEKKISTDDDASKNNKHLKNGILQSNREDGNFILSSSPPNKDNMLEDLPNYNRTSFGSLCFDHEISKVPIFTKTSDGIEVLNRVAIPYSSEKDTNSPKSGYVLAYHLWFECLWDEMEIISRQEEDIKLCVVTGDSLKDKNKLDYLTIMDCKTIEEAKQLILDLPSLIETRMEGTVGMIINGSDPTFGNNAQQNE